MADPYPLSNLITPMSLNASASATATDGSGNTLILQILFQVLLIFLNAVFACAEIAVISMNGAKLDQLVAKGDKKAKKLAKLTEQPAKFLSTIQVAITLAGFLGSAFAADNFAGYIVNWLYKEGGPVSKDVINSVSVILVTLILSYFTLIFGELVPKRLAMKKTEQLALGMSGMLRFFSIIFAPIVWLLTVSTNGVLRLLGIDPNAEEEEVTEEEIRMMVDAGSEKGAIDVEEKELIQNVFEFDDLTANEIATHRTEISLLWMDETAEEWEETIHESRHTYFPICEESVDNVIGVLNAKDYFRLTDKSRENVLKEAVKPAYLVPEAVKADVLFKNMKKTHNYFAVVLDEYGGMSGIVTMTDLIECIVGDLEENNEINKEPEKEIEPIDSKTWKISGSAPIDDVIEALGITLEEESDCDTFGGYVMGIIGTIPEDGTTLTAETEHLSIKVTEIKDHRIERTVVCLLDPPADENSDDKDKKEKE